MRILDGVTGRLRASQHLEVKSIESHGGNIQNGRRQETELSWSLPEVEPTTGTNRAPHAVARVEADVVLECEGQGSCP